MNTQKHNVDLLLMSLLLEGIRKPKVALFFTDGLTADPDFSTLVRNTSEVFEYIPCGATFAHAADFVRRIHTLDDGGYDLICIINSGRSDNSIYDSPEVCEALANLTTPTATAIVRPHGKSLATDAADLGFDTPAQMGQYFLHLMTRLNENRDRVRLSLMDSMNQQITHINESRDHEQRTQMDAMKQQVDDTQQQNATLQQQIVELTRQLNDTQTDTAQLKRKARRRGWTVGLVITLLALILIAFCIEVFFLDKIVEAYGLR